MNNPGYPAPPRAAACRREVLVPLDRVAEFVAGRLADGPSVVKIPGVEPQSFAGQDLLVCTHGTVDACCALFGYPFYRDLRRAAQKTASSCRVWRSTHIGGHRFAPTVLDLPDGRYWEFMTPERGEAIVTRSGDVADLHEAYRCWAGYEDLELQTVEREAFVREEGTISRAGRGPETESPVDMHPGAGGMGERDQLREWIESANIEAPGLKDDDGCHVRISAQSVVQDRGRQSPILIGRKVDDGRTTDSEQTNYSLDRTVSLIAADEAEPRCARQSVALNIPAGPGEETISGCCQAGDMAHPRARDQGVARSRWQPEKLLEPRPTDFLDHRLRRTSRHRSRVLVPGRGQPVRGECGWRGAADHPAEEATAGAPEEPSGARGCLLVDDLGSVDSGLIEGPSQGAAQLGERGGGDNGGDADGFQMEEGVRQGAFEGSSVKWRLHALSFPVTFFRNEQ